MACRACKDSPDNYLASAGKPLKFSSLRRASDDFEGDLGHQLDVCMRSAISQCWGGSLQAQNQSRRPPPSSSEAHSSRQGGPLHDGHKGSDQSGQPDRSA